MSSAGGYRTRMSDDHLLRCFVLQHLLEIMIAKVVAKLEEVRVKVFCIPNCSQLFMGISLFSSDSIYALVVTNELQVEAQWIST